MSSSIPALKKSTLKKLAQDPVATAKAIQLVYVNSKDEGIERAGAGKGFQIFVSQQNCQGQGHTKTHTFIGHSSCMEKCLDMQDR
jgi:hypothetical protein